MQAPARERRTLTTVATNAQNVGGSGDTICMMRTPCLICFHVFSHIHRFPPPSPPEQTEKQHCWCSRTLHGRQFKYKMFIKNPPRSGCSKTNTLQQWIQEINVKTGSCRHLCAHRSPTQNPRFFAETQRPPLPNRTLHILSPASYATRTPGKHQHTNRKSCSTKGLRVRTQRDHVVRNVGHSQFLSDDAGLCRNKKTKTLASHQRPQT